MLQDAPGVVSAHPYYVMQKVAVRLDEVEIAMFIKTAILLIIITIVAIILSIIFAIFFKKMRTRKFWLPFAVMFVGFIIVNIVTVIYLEFIDSWARREPGATVVLVYIFYLLSLIPPAIWWALRRFQFEKSRGPLILWIFTYFALIASDYLTG